jgi:4Fe-4S iron-sulfur cluster binding domain/DR2241 stabilising domain
MPDATERTLQAALADGSCYIGQLCIRLDARGFIFCHRDDVGREELRVHQGAREAAEIARFDDARKYRPLKTAPNLCHGWQLQVESLPDAHDALDHFYPGRLAVLLAHREGRLGVTPLRGTLNRQTGMYRVAEKISDEQIDAVVFGVCRSDGGCLRTILWKRDATGATPSTKLPAEKFDPSREAMPLLCPEACALLVEECRNTVKKQGGASAKRRG